MSGTLDIGRADIATRLIGDGLHGSTVESRLQAMLCDEVLPRVADRLDKEMGAETILCLPDLPILIQMTLAEALTQTGVTLWSDALFAAIQARIASGEDVWTFENRWAFLAAYLRDRLGLTRLPEQVFSGLSTLDLLSPGQAVCESLRVWPEIWPWLGQGNAHDRTACLAALRQRGGMQTLHALVLIALETEADVVPQTPASADLLELLRDPDALIALLPALGRASQDTADTTVSAALIATLAILGQGDKTASVKAAMQAGLVLALLRPLCREVGLSTPISWTAALDLRLQTLPDRMRAASAPWMAELSQTEEAEHLLAALADRLAQGARAQQAARPASAKERISTETPADATPPTQTPDAQMITSPIAGVALCLPFFTENRIGQAFSAALRLAALAALGADGPVERPEDDPLLRALAGMDTRDDLPARPDEMDLLFVPEDTRARIMDAPSGAARFALWLEARFATSLPGLSTASHGFLQTQFFHRPGRLMRTETRLIVDIDAPPLRAVLDLSGVIGPAPGRATWLNGEEILIRLREVSS